MGWSNEVHSYTGNVFSCVRASPVSMILRRRKLKTVLRDNFQPQSMAAMMNQFEGLVGRIEVAVA